MLERVKEAVRQVQVVSNSYGEATGVTCVPRAIVDKVAREVIAAILDPTDAMLNAARDWSYKIYGKPIGNDAAMGCYQAMIKAMLSDG